MECQHCRTQLLELAYGLLDDATAIAVQNHVQTCPACQASRQDAVRTQTLLARAAKLNFSDVNFQEPEVETARKSYRIPAAIYALAAALLIGVISLPALLKNRTDGPVVAQNDPPPVLKPEVTTHDGRGLREQAPKEWEAAAKSYRVIVFSPETAKAGQEYRITAINSNRQAVKVRVTLLVKNSETVLEKKSFETDATWTLTPALYEKLTTDSAIHLTATTANGDTTTLRVPLK